MKAKRWISMSTLVPFVAWILLLTGCGSEEVAGSGPEPPDIPPVSTFVMDFSDFTESTSLTQPSGDGAAVWLGAAKENWTFASLNVLVWNTVLTVGLAVPTASFIAAFGKTPVLHTDSTWVWSYNFFANDVLHLAELHGRVDGNQVTWSMYISKQDAFTDFLWYTGISDLDVTEGSWTLYDNPDNPTPLLGITWHRNPDEGTCDITYTNIVPEGPENGGYISYGITGNTPYDAFYDIYNKGADNHTDIEWNLTTKEGRVRDPLHFGDSEWHCWDTALEDVDCP